MSNDVTDGDRGAHTGKAHGRVAWRGQIFSLSTSSGRIGLIVTIVVLTALLSPLILASTFSQPSPPTTEQQVVEAWPSAPATYVAPVAPPALTLRDAPTPFALPAPQWQALSHLTVIEVMMSTIAEVQRTANVAIWGDLVTDHLLIKATGEIQLGIDLSQVANVEIDGESIRFTVPKPEIISVELLPDKSQIFESRQVLFLSNYSGLESEALEAARQQLRAEVAANQSMTELAEEFGRLKLTDFLHKIGYTNVDITFVEGEALDD